MTFYIEKIKVELTEESGGLRLTTHWDNYYFSKISIEELKEIIGRNFVFVKNHYLPKSEPAIAISDLNAVCLQITLFWLSLYNSWKNFYEKYKDSNLMFDKEDFTHPYTHDDIINYFKRKDSKNYFSNSAILIGKTEMELRQWKADRDAFYESFK